MIKISYTFGDVNEKSARLEYIVADDVNIYDAEDRLNAVNELFKEAKLELFEQWYRRGLVHKLITVEIK